MSCFEEIEYYNQMPSKFLLCDKASNFGRVVREAFVTERATEFHALKKMCHTRQLTRSR